MEFDTVLDDIRATGKTMRPIVGNNILSPDFELRVVSTEFERDKTFPEAVAQVVVISGSHENAAQDSHIFTPWGVVQVVESPKWGRMG